MNLALSDPEQEVAFGKGLRECVLDAHRNLQLIEYVMFKWRTQGMPSLGSQFVCKC